MEVPFTINFQNSGVAGARYFVLDFTGTTLVYYLSIFTLCFQLHPTNSDVVYISAVNDVSRIAVNWKFCTNVPGTDARNWVSNVILLI